MSYPINKDTQGFGKNKQVAKEGGAVAGVY